MASGETGLTGRIAVRLVGMERSLGGENATIPLHCMVGCHAVEKVTKLNYAIISTAQVSQFFHHLASKMK